MLQRLKEVIWTYLLETTQMFLSSMASQLAQGDMTEADAAELSFLQQEPGSGLLTAYLGGSCLPTTYYRLLRFPSWGFIQCLVLGVLHHYVYFKSSLVTHFRYKEGNTSYPLVPELSLGIGNNETAENNREKKPDRGKYNHDGKQGRSSWKRKPEKYKQILRQKLSTSQQNSSLKENRELNGEIYIYTSKAV